MTKIRFTTLIAALGRALDIPDLAPDENGFLALRFEGGPELSLDLDADTGRIRLRADLMDCRGTPPPGLGAMLCAANLHWRDTGGATLGLDRENRAVCLVHGVHMDVYDEDGFVGLVGTFLGLADHWRAQIQAFLDGGAAPEVSDAPIIPNDFIRI